MGEISEALYAQLKATAALTAVVGDSIYPAPAPQDAGNPYVTYQQISGPPDHLMGADSGQIDARFDIGAWGASHQNALDAAVQVRKALQDFSGSLGGLVTVPRVLFEDQMDLPYDFEGKTWHIVITVRIWFIQT